jgi:molecular chaperone DnaK (HSP70)
MAGYISKIRTIIGMNKLVNNEAVISVPSYYTQVERQALLNACKIA